ncbi:eukaryotic translation initiation factor 5B [Colletotrichum spaethianum]|uniref:Eukaryotic translation initiation factor 5B n=1 Tax=Colletotrichum spaethianum TaxID=700344 RepID=A0AA37PDG5_9PEZI|nr:eukaryotic translation initiation factor 5B [Colletotrichum spaethianum]GKT50197.1 eukaryotic translation initiation factor 5B [Colletotrichum spaethianum]
MPPKKKGNKARANDDWENELGETVAPAAATPEADAEKPAEEEDEAPGGLMATMRKNREKRKKKGIEEPPAAPEPEPEPSPSLAEKAPQEATMEDEFALPEKKGKGGKGKQAAAAASPAADDEGDGSGRVLTKAEKEKLKKEREKQRKKEQAAKKKGTTPAAKTEPAKAAPEKKDSPTPAASAVAPPPAEEKGGKKKKVPAALAALQKQQEELRRQQEEQARMAEEEKKRIEEEERAMEEENKRREEAKALKKQKEKEKIEQLKKEGKFLTKAQKEEKARNERKLQQMLAAGIKVGPADEADGDKKKKVVYDNKKKGGRKAQDKIDEEKALAEAAERARKEAERLHKEAEEKAVKEKAEAEAAAAKKKAAEASDLEDDWEAAAASEEEDVKDSWDADSDEEQEKKKAANGKPEKPARKGDEDEDEEDDSESDSESDDSEEDEKETAARQAELQRKREAAERREKAHQAALAARSKDNLRSPICCILGHVDTGKTKLLDKIRQTNVQEGEAGGITQQIGATYFPVEAIRQKTAVVNTDGSFEFKVPGLLVIDTPGHESFSNLRSRGSSLCNIAILVVDIMHGLEPQTLESMRMLRERKTPFVVALNKIDRLYGWKKVDNNGFQESLALQPRGVQNEFKNRLEQTKLAFAEQGFNAELFYENKSMAKNVSLIPTSAHTGEGIPDMLKLIIQLTQERMVGSLMYLSEVQATVLEVKAIEGFGMTVDVVLSNGILREGDRIVLCGVEGAICTNIRALLTPAPMRELRLKSAYVHNKEVKAALGVKISAPGLEGAIAGSRMMVVGPDDDEDDIIDEVESDLATLFSRVEKTGRGTNPIVVGVDVVEGQLKINTPIAVVKNNAVTGLKEVINLGRVTSIERDHKQVPVCKKGQPSVAVKIEMGGHQPTYGRQLEESDTLYSLISRASIDTLKEFYRKDVSNDEWQLIIKLKPLFDIH